MHRPDRVRFPSFVAPLAFASLLPAASGQAVLRSWYDPNALLSTYGLPTLGDVDGDAVPDFAAGGARFTLGGYADGYIEICSGADGSVLRTISTPGGGTNLGASLARMPDFDGDGVDDLVAGDPLGNPDLSGFVEIFSSTTGTLLKQYDGPAGYFGFGSGLAVCRDFTGDRGSDLVVLGGRVASTLPSREVAFTLSGADGSLLATFESPPKKRGIAPASAL